MVNLEKISNLLEKGVENPSLRDKEGKFSGRQWKKEVQEYTEPFLRFITDQLNEALKQEMHFWRGNTFEILSKSSGKKTRILSLQDAVCKVSEPFGFIIRDGSLRLIDAVIVLSPSTSCIEEKYRNCVLWGLRWWGTNEIAETAYDFFDLIKQDYSFAVSLSKDKALGGSYAWLSNSVTAKELIKTDIESIAEKVTEDFLKLSSILSGNRARFPPPTNGNEYPTKNDVEKAIRHIWSSTGETKINKSDVLEMIELDLKKKEVKLKSDWRKVVEKKLEDWFR